MGKASADVRLARLLDIVPWIAARDGPEIAEVCRRFDISEPELLAELNLLFMCGLYPFTPDMLIDVDMSDGRVWIRFADYFRRPLRLSPQEGLALASAAAAFLSVPEADADGSLASALAKLETVLGVGADEALEVELGPAAPGVLDALRSAAGLRRKVEIDYYSFGRDRRATRVVHPWRVFNTAGHWYVEGWCEDVDARRTFRVDRVMGVETRDETFPAPESATDSGAAVYRPGPEEPVWVLDLDPAAHWIPEEYPVEGVSERPDGVLRVTLRSGQSAWLERLLLRAGPHARVVEGDPSLPTSAASRLLGRYRGQAPVN